MEDTNEISEPLCGGGESSSGGGGSSSGGGGSSSGGGGSSSGGGGSSSGGRGSYSGAVFNLSSTVVGAGIMALPAVVRVLGLIPGLLAIVAAAALAERSVDVVLRVGRSSSYAGAVGEAIGEVGRSGVPVCVVANNLGMLVIYMIIIGDVLSGATSPQGEVHHKGVLVEWFGTQWWNERRLLLFLTSLLVFTPLVSFRRVDSLKYTSALSVMLAVVSLVITAGIAIVEVINGSISMPRLLPHIVDQKSFWKLFTTVPILVTSYICHYSLHAIEKELRDPRQMRSIVRTSLVLCCMVYMATSFFGFLLFGEQTLDDVLANFDTNFEFMTYGSLLNDAVRVSYAVHLMLVFPIVFYSLRLNLSDLLFPRVAPWASDSQRFYAITFVLMVVVFLGANFVSGIWIAFQIIGATVSVAIGFVFPAVIALRDVHRRASWNDKALSWLMMFLAVFSSTVAIASGVYSLFKKGHDS